jgi:hypothetical protein
MEYCVAPDRMEGWINIYKAFSIHAFYWTKQAADEAAGRERVSCVHMREVIDD